MKQYRPPSQESASQFVERFLHEQNSLLQRYSRPSLKKQSVLTVTRSGSIVTVTTSGAGPRQRRRYLLRNRDGAWKMAGTKRECSQCSSTGTLPSGNSCTFCSGAGWTIV